MLLHGANAVGYSDYPDNMAKRFVEHSVQSGMAIFLEAMKMYTSVTAPLAGLVNRIDVAEGDVAGGGSCLSAPCDRSMLDRPVIQAPQLRCG